jgi:uncharacterized membrane protein
LADIDNLFPLRLISVFAGTAALYVTYLLAKCVFGRTWVVIDVALLALDPLSLVWSGYARMSALEQLFVALAVLFFIRAITASRGNWVGSLLRTGWRSTPTSVRRCSGLPSFSYRSYSLDAA